MSAYFKQHSWYLTVFIYYHHAHFNFSTPSKWHVVYVVQCFVEGPQPQRAWFCLFSWYLKRGRISEDLEIAKQQLKKTENPVMPQVEECFASTLLCKHPICKHPTAFASRGFHHKPCKDNGQCCHCHGSAFHL